MRSRREDIEEQVRLYKEEGNSEPILEQFHSFIMKYTLMFSKEIIDFENYDTRYFLSCFLKESEERGSLRRGKYHTRNDIMNGYKVLRYLRTAFYNESFDEEYIYTEMIIPFLICVKRYEDIGSNFSSYLYSSYRYELIRHINPLLNQVREITSVPFHEGYNNKKSIRKQQKKEKVEVIADLDEDFILNHPNWISGEDSDLFSELSREERLILNKYYVEERTDKEIGRLIGRNRRSVNRSRNRIVNDLKEKFNL